MCVLLISSFLDRICLASAVSPFLLPLAELGFWRFQLYSEDKDFCFPVDGARDTI